MDEYRAFAEAPSLSLLHKWLIKNKWVKIPQLENNGYEEKCAEDIVDGKDWIFFFVPRKFLGVDGICGWMLRDEKTPAQIVRGMLQSEHEETLEGFLKLLRQQEENFRVQVCKSMPDLLSGSDIKTAQNEFHDEWINRFGQYAEVRKEKLNQLFQDESFKTWCEEELGWRTWDVDTEVERIAVLILIALLNLKCEQQKCEMHYYWGPNGQIIFIFERDIGYNIEFVNIDEKIEGIDSSVYSKEESENYFIGTEDDEAFGTDRLNEPELYGRRR